MIENESTGIRELDQILYGGINGGETVLFMHDIGSGYEFILLEIIRNHYHQGGESSSCGDIAFFPPIFKLI